jgi:hypothetical protein
MVDLAKLNTNAVAVLDANTAALRVGSTDIRLDTFARQHTCTEAYDNHALSVDAVEGPMPRWGVAITKVEAGHVWRVSFAGVTEPDLGSFAPDVDTDTAELVFPKEDVGGNEL